jgi:hypothetical protein
LLSFFSKYECVDFGCTHPIDGLFWTLPINLLGFFSKYECWVTDLITASVDWLVSVVTHSPRIVACERSFLPFVLWYMTLLHTEKVALRDSFIFKNKKHTRRAHSGDPYLSGTFFALIFSCSWIQAQDFFHIFFFWWSESMVRRELALARFGCMYVGITQLPWHYCVGWYFDEGVGREREREREGIFSISHPSPQPILGEMPSLSPSGCTFNCG